MASLADVSRAIMNLARAAPKLDQATERALLAKHQADGDKAAVDRVAAANLRVVISAANSLRGYGLSLDDLVQEGCCGVMLAARKFDMTRDTPFGAYARLWAKAEMQEFILRNWSIVRLPLHSIEQKLFFKMRQLRNELSRDPDMTSAAVSAEIASRFGVSVQDVEVLQARMGGGDFSLNAPAFADEEGSAEWGDFLIGDMPSADDMIEDDQCAADLRFAMQALDDQERLIVEQRWLTDDIAPLNALADWFEVSVTKVRKIEVGAIEKLRRTMFERRARPNPAYVCRLVRHRHRPDEPQHGGAARRHAQVLQEPRPGSAPADDADSPLRFGQPPRAPDAGPEEIGHWLGEGAPGAARVGAVEASNLDAQRRLRCGDRQIGRVALIAAVDGPTRLAALGTPTDLCVRKDLDREMIRALLDDGADSALWNGKGDGHASNDGKRSESRHRPESIGRHPRKVSKSRFGGHLKL